MTEDVLDSPTYAPTFAAHLVGLTPAKVSRWLSGYSYQYAPRGTSKRQFRRQGPLVARDGADGSRYASFLDLIDLLFIKGFLNEGVSVQKLRRALDEAKRLIGGHHFAHTKFWTDGREVYLEVKNRADALLQLVSHGQWAIAPVIKHIGTNIEFSAVSGLSERWFPAGRTGGVVVDPRVAFGAPVVIGRGIKTAVVYDMFRAEGCNAERVSSWLNLSSEKVEAAVKYEEQLQSAA